MPLIDWSTFILLNRLDALLATLCYTLCLPSENFLSLNRAKVHVSLITTGLAQTLKLPSVSSTQSQRSVFSSAYISQSSQGTPKGFEIK